MEFSENTSNNIAFVCLFLALLAFGKALSVLPECIYELYQKLVIVKEQEVLIAPHLYVTRFYRFGFGNECIFDKSKGFISNRSFRWERTKQGEIREVEQ